MTVADLLRYLTIALAAANWAVGIRVLVLSWPRRATYASPYHVYAIASSWLIVTGTIAGTSAVRIGQGAGITWYITVPFLVGLAVGLSSLLELHQRIRERG